MRTCFKYLTPTKKCYGNIASTCPVEPTKKFTSNKNPPKRFKHTYKIDLSVALTKKKLENGNFYRFFKNFWIF